MNNTVENILKDKASSYLIEILGVLISGIFLILTIFLQQIFPNLTLDKIGKLILFKTILLLLAVLSGLIAYIIAKNSWAKIEKQYELKEIIPGYFVYSYKKTNKPIHYLCTNCFKDKKTSILRIGNIVNNMENSTTYSCPDCKTKYKIINETPGSSSIVV